MNQLINTSYLKDGVCVIKFFAEWCAPCRIYAPIMENVSKNIDNVKFFSVNIDEQKEFAEHFNVTSIPCTIITKNGKLMENFVGVRNAKDLTNIINRYKN